MRLAVATPPAAEGDSKGKAESLKRERDAAWSEYEAVDKRLKEEHGRKYENRPPEVSLRFRDDERFLVFMTVDDQRWRDVMNVASGCINELVKVHGAGLTGTD